MNIISKLAFAFLLTISFPDISISESHQDANKIVEQLQGDFGKCTNEVKVSIEKNKLMLFGKHWVWLVYQNLTIPLDRLGTVMYYPENLYLKCEDREGDCIKEEITWAINDSPIPSATINFRGYDCNFEERESIANQIYKLVKIFN